MYNSDSKRVVVLVDMDCFYCQVEVQHNQSLAGKPVAVVQYNSWKGGGIIAVNYEARAKGVNRHMRGDEAMQKCADINLVRVKELHGKADLSKYRSASQKVFEVLSEFSPCVQRASIDEAYIDITSKVNDHILCNINAITETDLPNTFIEGYSDQDSRENRNVKSWIHDVYNNELEDDYLLRLTVGAIMVEQLRESVFNKTGFRCSAGISTNKILAKLACGLHKPNQQTLLPPSSIPHLFETIPIKKVRNLGGKLGLRVRQKFNCEFMSDLAAIPLNDLRKKFDEKTCNFLYQVSKGIDNEPVESRLIAKSIGSCKSFPLGLKGKDEVKHWLTTLMNDIANKLDADYETNKRKATLMTVSVKYLNKEIHLPTSQCGEVTTYNYNKLLDSAFTMLCSMTENQKSLNWKNTLSFLGVSIGKFVEIKVKSSIDNYFNKEIAKEENDINIQSHKSENETFCSKTNDTLRDTPCSETQLNSTNSVINQLLPSLYHSNTKKDKTSAKDVKSIKTMFTKMKDTNNTIVINQNISSKNEEIIKQNKLNMNSFFSKKLEIISPIKNQINDKLTTVVQSSSVNSVNSKQLEIISPSKNIENNIVKIIAQPSDSFFTRKLKIVSPSKHQTNNDLASVSIIESPNTENSVEDTPTMLLCERCNKMIDIERYDEHIDYHVAIELSKSINATEIVRPINNKTDKCGPLKKKANGCGQKRKHNSKDLGSISKKSCKSISSYFKPVLNP